MVSLKKRRLNSGSARFLDVEAEQSSSDSSSESEQSEWLEVASSSRSNDDGFIVDDEHWDSDGDSDRAGPWSNSPVFHINANRATFASSSDPAKKSKPTRFYYDSDSSSESGWSRESSPAGSSNYDSQDTLYNIVEHACNVLEPMWRFQCRRGEEDSVIQILRTKCPCSGISFKSYNQMRGWIYVQSHPCSPELCKWISTIRGVTHASHHGTPRHAKLVCEAVEPDASGYPPLSKDSLSTSPLHRWVRIKSGTFQGDIGYAYSLAQDSKNPESKNQRVKVLLVPRISLSLDANMSKSGDKSGLRVEESQNQKRKRCHVTGPEGYRLFDAARIRSTHGPSSVKQINRGSHAFHFNGERYQHGLLVKAFRVNQLQEISMNGPASTMTSGAASTCSSSSPSSSSSSFSSCSTSSSSVSTISWDIATLFVKSRHPDIPSHIRDFPRICEWRFEEGEEVIITSTGSKGFIKSRSPSLFSSLNTDLVEVLSRPTSHNDNIASDAAFPWWDLAKVFGIGDYVEVIGGTKKGSCGWVVLPGNGEDGENLVEVIEKTTSGYVLSPSGDVGGMQTFTVHCNILRKVSVPFDTIMQLPPTRSLYSLNATRTMPSLTFNPSASGSSLRTEPCHPWQGVSVIIVHPLHPDKGKRGIVKHVARKIYNISSTYAVLTMEVCESTSFANGFEPPTTRPVELELDYYSVVDEKTRRLLHEAHPLRKVVNATMSQVPWKGVDVTIISNHSDKGKQAIVKDVVPYRHQSTRTRNSNKGKDKAVPYPSGLKITVELCGATDRTNPTLTVDYYDIITEDPKTKTKKYLNEVYKLNAAQSATFEPVDIDKAWRLNPRIPRDGIPLQAPQLDLPVSLLTPQIQLTSAAGNTSGSIYTQSQPAQSTTFTSSSTHPVAPSLAVSDYSSVSSLNIVSLPSSATSASSCSGLPLPPLTPTSSSRSSSSHSSSPPPSSSTSDSGPSSDSRSTPPTSPERPTRAMTPSDVSDADGVSLGSSDHANAEHWITNPQLVGKKIVVMAHGGDGWRNKTVTVVPTQNDNGEIEIVREHYNKRHFIRPELIWQRIPNSARDNGLLIVAKGKYVGKYVRRLSHSSKIMRIEVVEHKEGEKDQLTGEELELDVDDLCVAYESKSDKGLNKDLMKNKRRRKRHRNY